MYNVQSTKKGHTQTLNAKKNGPVKKGPLQNRPTTTTKEEKKRREEKRRRKEERPEHEQGHTGDSPQATGR
jgi:hypothetical protein